MSTALILLTRQINDWATQQINSGVSYLGHPFSSDPDSRALIAGWAAHLASGGSLPEGFVWRTTDNQDVALTPEDIAALNAAFVLKANRVRGIAWDLKARLQTVQTYEEAALLLSTTLTEAVV